MPRTRKPRILLAEDDQSVRAFLLIVCREQGYEVMDTDLGREALEMAGRQKPDLILLDWGLPDMTGIEVIQALRRSQVTAPIIMLTGRGGKEAGATVTAVEDGVLLNIARDDLMAVLEASPAARAELDLVIEQRAQLLQGVAAQRAEPGVWQADLTAVYSPKGGTGKTTIALNVAATLARERRGEVLLIDLSLPFNHAALLARLAPSTCLARLAATERGFEELLQSALVAHPAGFILLPTALTPEEADLVSPALVAKALDFLRRQFQHIVFDLGVALTETALSGLDHTRHVIVVA